jgi:hypothetical protein
MNAISRFNWYFKYAAMDMILLLCAGLVFLQFFEGTFGTHATAWLDVAQIFYESRLFTGMYAYGIFFYNY